MGFFLLVFILFSHVSTRFFGYSAQRNIVPKRGRSKFPSRGNCTSRTNALYLFSIHLSRNCQATASFSAIVHEPRLQNLSKKSIKSLLSEALFHRMRFQICPPLHAFRGMEMDAVGGQFFSQAIVLHGHVLRHIQIQALLFSRRFLQKCVIYCNNDSSRGQVGSRVGGWDFSGPVSTESSGSSTCAVTAASRTGTCGVSSGTAEAGGLPDSRTQNAPISITAPPKMTPAAAAVRFLTHLFHGNTSPTVSFTY